MKSYFSRFLHHTLSHSGIREVFTSSLSLSDLIGESRLNKVANLSHLDYRVKPDNDNIRVDYRVKPDNDGLCTGRSMVEMLGVLAIIGVLSVGAIAGYSKAMMKYKLNKHAEQMNTVINAVARNVHNFDNIKQGGTSLTSYFIKMGEIPTEMIKQNQTNLIYDIFGQGWNIFITGDGSQMLLSTYSTDGSSSLTAKSANNLDICKNIITAAKENSDSINYMLSVNNHSSANQISSSLNGGTCSSGNKCLKNLKLDDIYDFCTKHYGVNSPTGTEMMISWKR